MRWPTQSEVDQDRHALAPYNFVPLPDRVIKLQVRNLPDQDQYDAERLTGYLDCELITESPVYTRAGLTVAQYQAGSQAKDQSDFFFIQRQDEPVIPGSSLRGLLRSLIEIVSYSKVTLVTNSQLVYRAVGDTTSHGERYRERLMQDDGNRQYTPLVRGGYMTQNNRKDWEIQPAQVIEGTTYAVLKIDERLFKTLRPVERCRNAFEVFIQTGPYTYQSIKGGFLKIRNVQVLRASAVPGQGLRPATLARSGWMMSKRTEAVIYERDDSAALLPLSDEKIQAYKEQLSKEQKHLLGDKGVLQQGQPVFYILDEQGQVDFFGHCRMFRLPYPNTPLDYVPSRLRETADLDLAEAIFGYTKDTGEGKDRAYAGRVFVSDAQLLPGQQKLWLTEQPLIPRILATPKPTTFQHYLVQTTPNRQQVGRTKDDKSKYATHLLDYATPFSETVIRGHKQYWHKGAVTLDDLQDSNLITADDTQHTRFRPLRSDVKFQFRLDFENLSPVELGALLWVLDKAADDRYRLKIGMGKPLGMGAIRITSRLYLSDRIKRYQILLDDSDWNQGFSEDPAKHQEVVSAFERLVLEFLDERVVKRLEELPRIQSLLTMLSWPGPDPSQTRYLEIERIEGRRKRNEYKDRPVLPTPLDVVQKVTNERREVITGDEPQSYHGRIQSDGQKGIVEKVVKSGGFVKFNDQSLFFFRHQWRGDSTQLRPGQPVTFRKGKGMRGNDEAKEVKPINDKS